MRGNRIWLTDGHGWTQILQNYTAALGQVNGSEPIDALEFDDGLVFNDQVRDIFADQLSLVTDRVGNLCVDGDAAQG